MKKFIGILIVLALIAFFAVYKHGEKEAYLVKINKYMLTPDMFEKEFKDSAFAKNDTPESRKEFLQSLIQRRLILQDAQVKGLDKDKEFLMAIERFWEQSLLQRAIESKNREIAGSVSVSEQAVAAEYTRLQAEGKADKPYEQMSGQIKRTLVRDEERKAMEQWIAHLVQSADIKVAGGGNLQVNGIGRGENGQ